jgi:dihydrofolate synthase/folylpolyglutamate synthase
MSAKPSSSAAEPASGAAAEPRGADPVLERLKGLHPKVIDLGLGRVGRLLAALGDPQRHLAPVIHVAGTNGKGSTVAFLRAMLEAAGKRVHVYTSPHLVRFNERIRVAGALVDDERLGALLEECEAANAGAPITFFEITTVAALLAFARTPADAVLLETGLGGRLDATNVVERPAVTAITRISFDHRSFLGDTLEAIAGEKAGIFKPGVPAVLAPQPAAAAARTLMARASAIGAPVHTWSVTARADGGLRFDSPSRGIDLPPPGLAGAHQLGNAGVAVACLDHLPFAVSDTAVAQGLVRVEWPARLQRLGRGPLVQALPPGWELWLDGGHNDSAGEVLAVQATAWAMEPPALPLVMIHGMLASKEPLEFLGPLVPHVAALRAVAVPGEEASRPAGDTAVAARVSGIGNVAASAGVGAALADLIVSAPGAWGGGPARVLICGSLYLAGAVLAENG